MAYDEIKLAKHRKAITRGEKVPVTLTTRDDATRPGFLQILHLSQDERNARGRRFFFTCLAIAPFAAVCPPHIPWPIVMIFVAFIGAAIKRRPKELVLGGEGTCPSCGAFQLLEGGSTELPILHFCGECQRRMVVAPSPVAATEAVAAA